MPRVLNKRTDVIPAGAVYVGRPSKWGNPFVVGSLYKNKKIAQESAVSLFQDWLLYSDEGRKLLAQIGELKGKDLVCWCVPKPCHAEILLELANK